MAISSALSSITSQSFFDVIAWTRIHYITIGSLVQFMIGFIPLVIQQDEERKNEIRWDIWLILNTGFITFLTGRAVFNDTLIITGGLLLFLAIVLFLIQILFLTYSIGSIRMNSGEVYYITGTLLFLVGIVIGTGIWVNWSTDLRIAVPLEVHIHANNWGFASFIFTGLFLDLFPSIAKKRVDWRINPKYIYAMMLPGAIGLILGPWVPSQWLSVPGLVLHLVATAAMVINGIQFSLDGKLFGNNARLMLFSGYLWFLAPVFVAPFIVFKIGDFSSYDVEGYAPEALVYGWLMTMLVAWIYLILAQNIPKSNEQYTIFPLLLTHLGSILLWVSIFAENTVIYGCAYLLWGVALMIYLIGIISLDSEISRQVDLLRDDYSTTWKYLSIFFSFVAVGFYLLILSGEIYASGRGPQFIIPVLGSIGFFIGGSLIMLENKKLIMLGLFINIFVIFIFFVGHLIQGESFEVFGILTKVNQVILELVLLGYYKSLR